MTSKELYAKAVELKLTPNQYFVLLALQENNAEALEGIKSMFNNDYIIKTLTSLERKKYLKITDIPDRFDSILDIVHLRTKASKVEVETPEEWITEWSNLWKGIRTPGPTGYYTKDPPAMCLKRMKQYLKDNKEHNKELIFKATKKYLAEKKKVGYAYTKKSMKFIMDTMGSELYKYCEAVLMDKELGKETTTEKPRTFGRDIN